MESKVSEVKQSPAPLEPIEIEKDNCPTCRKVLSVVGTTFATTAFCTAAGAALSLTGVGITLITGIFFGALVGIVVGVALGIFLINNELSPEHKYCLLTLDQIKKARPDLKDTIDKASVIFNRNPITLIQAYENHDLANAVTELTPHMGTREDLKKIWEKFVDVLHGMEIVDNMGDKQKLDLSLEKERMKGVKIEVETEANNPLAPKIEKLNPLARTFENDLKQIHDLQLQCFGSIGTYSIDDEDGNRGSRTRFTSPDKDSKKEDGCFLVRRKGSDQILGFLWYKFEKANEILICSVGRKADATKLSIGKLLFQKFLQKHAMTEKITLNVRASNAAAIHLYKQHFFEVVDEDTDIVKNGYHSPVEDMHTMTFNKEAFIKAQIKEQKKAS